MKPLDLIVSATALLGHGSGKPSQANLRRAISSAYYAMFHALARQAADLLVGGQNSDKSKPAWRQVYRALEHNPVCNACRDQAMLSKFPKGIEDFANAFVALQRKRHNADYDPYVRFTKSEAATDVILARQAIISLNASAKKDRRAFCAYVLFKKRP